MKQGTNELEQAAKSGQPAGAGTRSSRSARHHVEEWAKSILLAVVLLFGIRTFLAEAFRIPSGSMEETLLIGDWLMVGKIGFGGRLPGTNVRFPALREAARGEVVVFQPPHVAGPQYVKRIVGVSGDTLGMRGKQLFLNGEPIAEAYVQHADGLDRHHPAMDWQYQYLVPGASRGGYQPTRDNWGPLIVPPDMFFMLGDNRDDSEDSRYWGFVRSGEVRGRPWFVYYSYDPSAPRPLPWITAIRWWRIGSGIR